MSRKLAAAALALSVAGGVYLAGSPAEASNMGFKLERSLSLVRDAGNKPLLNIYLVSFPLYNGLGDVANTADASTNKCVLDVGPPAGPATGDGVIDSNDAICDLWTSRKGTFAFNWFNRDTCKYLGSVASQSQLGGINFGGNPFVLPAEPDNGFQVVVSVPPNSMLNPVNQGVIVGSHDPTFVGRTIRPPAGGTSGCSPKLDLIEFPYHSMYQKADEVLCGLEGVDWMRDGMGKPNKCFDTVNNKPTGIFDGQHALSIQSFDNVPDGLGKDNGYLFRTVVDPPPVGTINPPLSFGGSDYDLRPGDAYLLSLDPNHVPTTWLSPHF